MRRKRTHLGVVQTQRLFEVLEDINAKHPGIRLYEVEFGEDVADVRYGKIWTLDELLETVERVFRNMTKDERNEFEAHQYFWGYLPDGRVSVGVQYPGKRGSATQFISVEPVR